VRLRLTLLFLLAATVLAGCGGTEGGSPQENGTQQGSEGSRKTGALQVETVLTNLDTPWEVVFLSDGRRLVTERPGTIRVVEDGNLREEPYAELDVSEVGEGGQLGLAADPNFEENGYLYAYYTTRESGELRNKLVRLVEEGDGSAQQDEVLLEAPAASIHDGGRVEVGPDGKLYATLGDTSQSGLAQDRAALAGKIVRLNLDGSVPEDNPFSDSPVYSYSHRNPQGLAWDGESNLYAPEHGPSAHDEFNLIKPGNNYGWPGIRGKKDEPGEECPAGYGECTAPILESGESTWAPSGAVFVGEGPWKGSVLFTGLRGQSLHRVVMAPQNPSKVQKHEEYLEGEYGRLRAVEQGPEGAIYVLTSNRDGRGNPAPQDDRMLKVMLGSG
jgi:glucose/arabinose dehydrogenase